MKNDWGLQLVRHTRSKRDLVTDDARRPVRLEATESFYRKLNRIAKQCELSRYEALSRGLDALRRESEVRNSALNRNIKSPAQSEVFRRTMGQVSRNYWATVSEEEKTERKEECARALEPPAQLRNVSPSKGDVVIGVLSRFARLGVSGAIKKADGVGLELDGELLNDVLDRLFAVRNGDGAVVLASSEFALDEDAGSFHEA